jgi:hypothetical protein
MRHREYITIKSSSRRRSSSAIGHVGSPSSSPMPSFKKHGIHNTLSQYFVTEAKSQMIIYLFYVAAFNFCLKEGVFVMCKLPPISQFRFQSSGSESVVRSITSLHSCEPNTSRVMTRLHAPHLENRSRNSALVSPGRIGELNC